MKMKIIIAVVTLIVLAGAAFVVASGGEEVNEEKLNALRGTDAYYVDSEPMVLVAPYGAEAIMTNIQGGRVLQLAFEIEYRVGMRWQEDPMPAADALAKISSALRSKLLITMSGRTEEDFKGAKLMMLREEIAEMINEMAFPNQEARVETVNLTKIFVQAGG